MERYDPTRQQEDFRRFDDTASAGVRGFYRLNHTYQTREFVREKKRQYTARTRGEMGIWEAMEYLNTLVDESDPSRRSNTTYKARKRSARTATRAGWCWQV